MINNVYLEFSKFKYIVSEIKLYVITAELFPLLYFIMYALSNLFDLHLNKFVTLSNNLEKNNAKYHRKI